jgi:hypothetical protein
VPRDMGAVRSSLVRSLVPCCVAEVRIWFCVNTIFNYLLYIHILYYHIL